MNHQSELEKKKYRNWVRGGLAYKYLKEGIDGFADDVVQQEHTRIISAISHTPGLTCNQCCLGNLQPLHTCKKDHAGRSRCPWGQLRCNCVYRRKQSCPSNICDSIMEDILKSHGSTPPTPKWTNTDVQKWCSAPWEIAKCFINAPGYSDKTKAADIDTPGLLHVFINNINVQSHFSKRLNGNDIFKKTLQRRNELFHSPNMEMEENKLDECIDDIIAILEDEKELKARHDSQQAVLKLKQLKQESFIITTHNEAEVCRDSLASITNKSEELKKTIQEAKDEIVQRKIDATQTIGDNVNECKDALVSVTNKSEELKQTIQDAKDDIGKRQTEVTEAIGEKVNECNDAVTSVTNKSAELKQTIEKTKADIGKKQTEATKAIEDKTQKALREIDKHNEPLHERIEQLEFDSSISKQRLTVLEGKVDEMDIIRQNHQIQLEYVEGKQVLQKGLVELYQNHYVNTSISPLKLQENNINIKEVYVAPEMVVEVKPDRSETNFVENTQNKRNISGYREILQTNGEKHKNVFIVGDVGTGKSTFSKMIIQNWCSAVTCRDDVVSEEHVDTVTDIDSVDVSNKAESSVREKDENCFSDKDESSICNKDESFIYNKDESSVREKKDESSITKSYANDKESSVSIKNENYVSNSDESPVSGNDEGHVSGNDEGHVSGKYESRVRGSDERRVSNTEVRSDCDLMDESSVSDKAESSVSDSDEDFDMYDSSDSDDFSYTLWYQKYFDQEQLIINENINEMKNFNFLFFVPLQRMSGLSDITEMIKAILTAADIASNNFIDRIFEQESERCLIVADGLDEWTPPKRAFVLQHVSYGLPNRHRAKHATLVTLSRPSAKGILKMKSSECDQKVELLGININSMVHFITTYLSKLNKTGLTYRDFMEKINLAELDHLEKTPLLLQQLVWLYATGNELGKSVSDVYSHLVNIMIGWSQNKDVEDIIEEDAICDSKQGKDMKLPRLLRRFPKCEENKRFLLPLARVAFEALTSETRSSTFGRSHVRQKGVPNEIITVLIKFGILVENNCFDPTLENTQLELIHISYLEFLAAVYVSSHFDEHKRAVLPNSVLNDLFQKCKSAADVLKLSNVLKMICGLSPFLISEISRLVSDIVSGDGSMTSQRNSLIEYRFGNDDVIEQIQSLVLNCLSECDSNDQPIVILCDVIIGRYTKLSFIQKIIPENVLSVYVDYISDVEVWRWITRLTRLQYMHVGFNRFPHSVKVLISAFIQEAHLKYLSLYRVECNASDCHGHRIDLDQHQTLELTYCHRVILDNINTKHLEILHLRYLNICFSHSSIDFLLNATKGCFSVYTRQLNNVVHSLQKLRKLILERVHIADSALTVTPEMRNLEHIELKGVSMSPETWCTFVDSLLTLQQYVQVDCIYLSVNVFARICEDKRNYVRRNTIIFEVMKDSPKNFKFRTKK